MAVLNCCPPLDEGPGKLSALHMAVEYEHPEAIGPLIEMGAALHMEGLKSYSPFQSAVGNGDRAMADIIFSYCKSLQDSCDRGPLVYASQTPMCVHCVE